MKQPIVAGSLGVAMVTLSLGFAPPSNAQGLIDGLTGLLGAQTQTSTTEPTATSSSYPLPESFSDGQEELAGTLPSGPAVDAGMAVTPDAGATEEATGSSLEGPEEGMVPQPFPAMPVQPGF